MKAPFTQYKPWMIERYGDPLFRIPIEIASSCPHGRCAFCSETGSRSQQTKRKKTPIEQIDEAIKFSMRRYHAKRFMLYIQAFTTDLTDIEQQKLVSHCLKTFSFQAISIGIRPDGLSKMAIHFLEKLKERTEVWVELGVQTVNDETLKKINRGHDWACAKTAILELVARGIHVAPHVILGLPDETKKDWNRTAKIVGNLGISGIKIHNLHIIKGTKLAENPPPTLSHWDYAEGLIDFLRQIPANIPVMRLSTDTPVAELLAPHWHLEKGQFLDYVIQQMCLREIQQGDFSRPIKTSIQKNPRPIKTDDGSITFYSENWREHCHTKRGARLEAEKKFIEPSHLAIKLKTSDIKILDVCFGLGNNTLAALCAQHKTDSQPVQTNKIPVPHLGRLDITALEIDKRIVRAASEFFRPLKTDPVNWKNVLSELHKHSSFRTHQASISLCFGDARWLIQRLNDETFDLIFHDPFSSQHCPELWTVEFFRQLYRVTKPDGILLTYSSALPVRGALREAEFKIAETKHGHQMGVGTIATKRSENLKFPILGALNKRRSIPYRDKHLCATSKTILRQRQETVEAYENKFLYSL